MNPERLYSFTKDRSIKFWAQHITELWQLGWLRADLITSDQELQMFGVNLIKNEDNVNFYYSDDRQLGIPQNDIEESLRLLNPLPQGMVLYFHPFKYYVLYHIQRVIGINIVPFQMFIQSQYPRLLETEIQQFNTWTFEDELTNLVNRWNNLTTLAIVTEPCFFTGIFGTLRHSPSISHEQQRENILIYRGELREEFLKIGLESLKEILSDFSTNAEMLDPNKNIHTLLRFMAGRQRLDVKGYLGGALLLKSMAEIVRRMAEWTYEVKLPEEDEMGFGWMIPGMKERVYGSSRIFDHESIVARRQFIRGMGFDPEVRIRIYVEGQTEFYALNYLISNIPQVEIINLAGQVQQKRGKGVAFRDNLSLDERSQVFSVILLDNDQDDNLRAVRYAAREDIFCGAFYTSDPDFEFGNFTRDELEEIVLSLVDTSELTPMNKRTFHDAIVSSTNGETLLKETRKIFPNLSQLGKGKEWGEKLAEYGWRQQTFPKNRTMRTFVEAVNSAIRSIDADFLLTRKNYRTDPETGKLVKRE